ncbi:hypothetical protein [Arthrobacter rhombi]|uniref:hypothetical protein n=1 Tax=Arthrobacter rhombi TaxID=71253 RepID=UPI003FD02597
MPQKHDIGQQKKRRRQLEVSADEERVSPQEYASRLVRDGRASFLVLGRVHPVASSQTPTRQDRNT